MTRLSHLHRVVAQICYNRGLTHPAQIAAFLEDPVDDAQPFALDGVTAAVARLGRAIRAGESIAVYGDFDVDGLTATVLLVQTLQALGGNVRPHIPNRLEEGYGLNLRALTELAADQVQVVVTVDCGIRSIEEVAHANRLGIDVIVTDHHSVGASLPPAAAVIDPKREDSGYPFDELAGVGVAYRLAQALLRTHRDAPMTDLEVRLEEADMLDLVALGTVADLVPLRGENRALVRLGLERINRRERPGIAKLCEVARIKRGGIDASAIGYALGPRLNAAGRLGRADVAYELLTTSFPAEAEMLAEQLDALNRKRQQLTGDLQDRAREVATSTQKDRALIFVAGHDYPLGIVGLVAGRLAEEFYRPAIVAQVGERVTRGSARSIPEFHITRALDRCQGLLERYGGHAGAAGFTVRNENLGQLLQRLQDVVASELSDVELVPALAVDVEVDLADLTWELEGQLAELEPHGYENPQPLLASYDVGVTRHRTVGRDGRHLKLTLSGAGVANDAIAFNQGEWSGRLPDRVDLAYHLEVNDWPTVPQLQLNVQDIRPARSDAVPASMFLRGGDRDATEA